jgi:hypothetical protein
MLQPDLNSAVEREWRVPIRCRGLVRLAFLAAWLLLALQFGCLNNSSDKFDANQPTDKVGANPTLIRLYRVQVNGKYGYIDRTGRVVIPPQYARAEDFSEGRCRQLRQFVSKKMGLHRSGWPFRDCSAFPGRAQLFKRIGVSESGFRVGVYR